jgi:crotonobetainyl-CoA:carnitine CoA-transferase CaiB-like acyl-CoA transferase
VVRAIRRPLEGIKVVDVSSFFAVGYGGRLLSDLGADVIKVETPAATRCARCPTALMPPSAASAPWCWT